MLDAKLISGFGIRIIKARSYRACEPRPTLLAQEVGEILLRNRFTDRFALAQRANALTRSPEGFATVRLQGTRLMKVGGAVDRRNR